MEEGIAATPVPQPGPAPLENQPIKPQRKRILWKWSLLAAALLFGYFVWQCGSGMSAGARLSDSAVEHFHSQLDSGDYEAILQESDPAFQKADSHDELLKFLTAVHSKLGKSQHANRTNIFVNASTTGTFIKTTYKSIFEHGEAEETFTWRKAGDGLKLVGYYIQSKELITR